MSTQQLQFPDFARNARPQRKSLCRLEQVLKVTDLLLQSGGFGMVVLDLGDIPAESARRVPLTSWFRFRRAVEPTATVLLLIEQEPAPRPARLWWCNCSVGPFACVTQ